jgi:hypothetical protein
MAAPNKQGKMVSCARKLLWQCHVLTDTADKTDF